MNNKRVAILPAEYNPKEGVNVTFDNVKALTKEVENQLRGCTMGQVKDAIMITGEIWNLRPNRAKEFKVIKRIVINSVNKN